MTKGHDDIIERGEVAMGQAAGLAGRIKVCFGMAVAAIWASISLSATAAEGPLWVKGLHYQTAGEVVPLAKDGIHDPSNSATGVLQEPVESMRGFPRDSAGIIDWVKVLDQGLVDPRQSLQGDQAMFPVDFDIIFKNTGSMPYVRFPHKPHTEWLTCANCHPAIFLPQRGGNPITMAQIIEGKYCGVCHGKVAFPPTVNCGRCHSVPREAPGLR